MQRNHQLSLKGAVLLPSVVPSSTFAVPVPALSTGTSIPQEALPSLNHSTF